jgi:sugar phosphate isomerase/epimerase
MTLLASSTLLFDYKLSEVIAMTREMGYCGVEIWHFQLERTCEKVEHLARLAEQLNAILTVHALSWDLNYCSRLPDIRESSLISLQKSIALTRDLGAYTVVIHPGRITIPNETPEANWPILFEGTQRLADYAENLGVNLSLELMEHIPREFFINPQDAHFLFQNISSSSMTITMDTAHVPFEQELIEYYLATPRIGHIHLSDCTSSERHLPLGKGERDHIEFLRYLKSEHNQTPITIEGLEFEHTPQLAMKNKLQFDRWMDLIS